MIVAVGENTCFSLEVGKQNKSVLRVVFDNLWNLLLCFWKCLTKFSALVVVGVLGRGVSFSLWQGVWDGSSNFEVLLGA